VKGMGKTAKSWRMESLAAKRLEQMARELKTTQTTLLHDLIYACFEEHVNRYQFPLDDSGFNSLVRILRRKHENFLWEDV
jgi:hypothetical protein